MFLGIFMLQNTLLLYIPKDLNPFYQYNKIKCPAVFFNYIGNQSYKTIYTAILDNQPIK